MKRIVLLIFFVMMLLVNFAPLKAQAPKLQAIHNAADPGLSIVNVTIFLAGFPITTIDSVMFREATPLVDVPLAGVPLDVQVSKLDNTLLLTVTVTLENGFTYIGIVRGVEDPAQFAPNPDGRNIALDTTWTPSGRASSTVPGEVQFAFAHGVTDAPTVDLRISGGNVLADNLAYGDLSGYVSLQPAVYVMDVTDQTGNTVLAQFDVDLTAYADSAMIMFMSGFMDPSQNQNGAELGLFAALPSGTVIEFPKILVGLDGQDKQVVRDFELSQNYPNPFNPSTTISFALPHAEQVTLEVFNITGQLVATLVNGQMSAGVHQVQFDAVNLPSGIYFYRLNAGTFQAMKRMVLIR